MQGDKDYQPTKMQMPSGRQPMIQLEGMVSKNDQLTVIILG
jgi:hypothetical protein